MKKNFLLVSVFLLLVASACTFQKRSHCRGYYIDWHKKSNNTIVEKEAVKNDFVASGNDNLFLPKKENANFSSQLSSDCGDTLYLLSGEKIICQITEINETHIKYKKCDNLNGPVYSTARTVASKIIYINHTSELFNAVNVKQIIQTNSCGDTIYLLSGEKIVCNVIDPNDDITTYQDCEQVNGSSKIISTSLIEKIIYENGSEVLINQDPNKFFPKEEIDFIKSNISCGDSIFLSSGKAIKCKIIEIGIERLKYKKCDDTSSNLYIVERKKLYATAKLVESEKRLLVEKAKQKDKQKAASKKEYHWTSKFSLVLAILSLVLAVVLAPGSLSFVGMLCAGALAFIFGLIALKKIKGSNGKLAGKGMAEFGLRMGIIELLVGLGALIFITFFWNI